MNARDRKQFATFLFGRKRRRDAGVPRTPQGWARKQHPPEPTYRRVTMPERLKFAKLRRKGRSLRWIGRRYRRTHHTVARWLRRDDAWLAF